MKVPLFINEGDKIKIDTRSGEYLERAKLSATTFPGRRSLHMTTSEKVAYLKGLAEGLGVDKETKEGRILDAILDILEDVAHDIEDLEENAWELGEAIDQVSDDLSDIEDIVYDLDEDEDDDEDEDECCGCCCEDEDEDEEPVFYEVTCPACENTITIDEDVLNLGSIECPNCGETLEFEGIEEDEDEDEGEDKD